jgi:nicotinate-nucleotide adenylyltransferase
MADESPRQIGLFGGSFNPPHICHTLATVWAKQTQSLDEIWWIPTFKHAFSKELLDFDHRLEMSHLAVSRLDSVYVSEIERKIGGESRTVDTVDKLRETYPDSSFSLLVGSDILEQKDDWKEWERLMSMVDLIVVGREGHYEGLDSENHRFRLPDISSTEMRKQLKEQNYDRLDGWLNDAVLDYIETNELYL